MIIAIALAVSIFILLSTLFVAYWNERSTKVYSWQVKKRKFMETRYKTLEHMLSGYRQNGRTQPVEIRIFFIDTLKEFEKVIRSEEDKVAILRMVEFIERGLLDHSHTDLVLGIYKRFPFEKYSFWHPVKY